MTREEINLLVDLLMILEDNEGYVYRLADAIFERAAVLPKEYFIKIKGVVPLQARTYSWYGSILETVTKFRPVVEVHLGEETLSFVFNSRATTLVYDVNSTNGVGPDSNNERVYEDLSEYTSYTRKSIAKSRLDNHKNTQKKALSDFLNTILLNE